MEEERPVYRIGINMQSEGKLKQQHIIKILRTYTSSQPMTPAIYCIKDEEESFVPSPL